MSQKESTKSLTPTLDNYNCGTLSDWLDTATVSPPKCQNIRKRKPVNQLSAEKTNIKTICEEESYPLISTAFSSSSSTSPSNSSKPSFNMGSEARPKMLRQTGKDLGDVSCVSAYYVKDKIIQKDAVRPDPEDSTPTMERVLEYMSNSILNASPDFCITMDTQLKKAKTDAGPATDDLNKKLFDDEGQTVTDLTNTARNYIFTAIEKRKDTTRPPRITLLQV